jgi:DNA-binding PadR family transcriptional regulator
MFFASCPARGTDPVCARLCRVCAVGTPAALRAARRDDARGRAVSASGQRRSEEVPVSATRRARALELAVLGHLADTPLHGYELRKRLDHAPDAPRTVSYGSLYPCLQRMRRAGLVAADPGPAAAGRRPRIVYRLTDAGADRLRRLLADTAPATADDECFGVHFTLFARTRAEIRLRVLDGRRARLLDRLGRLRARLADPPADPYLHELHRHRADALADEVGWLDTLIAAERRRSAGGGADAAVPVQRGGAPPNGHRRH